MCTNIFYGTNFAGTHYGVLAYHLKTVREAVRPPVAQHGRYRWMQPAEAARDPDAHPYSQAYFSN
jgi:colanic acid biosynthesis protein WcaH